MNMEIIDVHMHCFTGQAHASAVVRDIEKLSREGVRHLVVVGLINTHLDVDAMWDLIPDYVENRGDPLFNEVEDLLELARLSDKMIVPLIDTRHLWGDVPTILNGYIKQGFKGIKGIYLPDKENDLGVRSVPDTFGISLEQYRQREWEIFSFAQTHDLPLLYHMDVRRYGDEMMALLNDFPQVRVDFAHLGMSRKVFSKILDRYPNVFTDIASLLPHMRSQPESYRDFIMHYPDRVCFGSDAFLYQTETVLDYVDMVRDLKLPEEIETQVFNGNSARFLGNALQNNAENSSESAHLGVCLTYA